MPDFISRFGEIGSDGEPFLSSSRQSIITSLLSAGWVRPSRRSVLYWHMYATAPSCEQIMFLNSQLRLKSHYIAEPWDKHLPLTALVVVDPFWSGLRYSPSVSLSRLPPNFPSSNWLLDDLLPVCYSLCFIDRVDSLLLNFYHRPWSWCTIRSVPSVVSAIVTFSDNILAIVPLVHPRCVSIERTNKFNKDSTMERHHRRPWEVHFWYSINYRSSLGKCITRW